MLPPQSFGQGTASLCILLKEDQKHIDFYWAGFPTKTEARKSWNARRGVHGERNGRRQRLLLPRFQGQISPQQNEITSSWGTYQGKRGEIQDRGR